MNEDNLYPHGDEAGRVPGAMNYQTPVESDPFYLRTKTPPGAMIEDKRPSKDWPFKTWTLYWEADPAHPEWVELDGRRYLPRPEPETETRYSYYEPPPQETLDRIVADSRKVERNRLVWEAMMSVVSDETNWSGYDGAMEMAVKIADTFLAWRDRNE